MNESTVTTRYFKLDETGLYRTNKNKHILEYYYPFGGCGYWMDSPSGITLEEALHSNAKELTYEEVILELI